MKIRNVVMKSEKGRKYHFIDLETRKPLCGCQLILNIKLATNVSHQEVCQKCQLKAVVRESF